MYIYFFTSFSRIAFFPTDSFSLLLLLLLYLRCSKYGRVFTRICPINEIYYLIRVDSRWR